MKKIKLISLSLLALSPFVSAEENVSQKILIKSMIGGTGWSWNPKERDYDKGAYLRLDTANIFEGKCFSFDRNGKSTTETKRLGLSTYKALTVKLLHLFLSSARPLKSKST